jgi:hypothetical protein
MMFPLCFYSALPLKFTLPLKNRGADRGVKQHSIGVIKRVFGFAKIRYRGLTKNTHRLLVTCALANLFIARRRLLRCQGANQADQPWRRPDTAPTRPHFPVLCPVAKSPCIPSLPQPFIQTFPSLGSLRSSFHQVNPLSRPEDDPLACLDIAR